jgi:hypothetical protein
MSADQPTPEEMQFTALFAAGEELLASGKPAEAPCPAGTPSELEARLQRDLACVQLLHRALGRRSPADRAPSPAATIDPPPARTPEAVPVALAIGPGRESARCTATSNPPTS